MKKSYEANITKLETKMVGMSAFMEARGASSKEIKEVTPSCYIKEYDHLSCGIAMARKRPTLEAYTHTLSQTVNVANVPRGVKLATNALKGEAHRQVKLPEFFIL